MSIETKLTTIAENVGNVFNAGWDNGYNEGWEAGGINGYGEGKLAEYDSFWDTCQNNGNRKNYSYAFTCGWTPQNFKPKYKIILPANNYGGVGMFRWFNPTSQALDYREVKDMIDTSATTNATEMFCSARINYIDVDLSNATTLNKCFSAEWQGNLLTTLTLKVSDKCTNYSGAFGYCINLSNLTFPEDSDIAVSISFSDCPLTKASITSVINALSSSATGKTATFKKTAKEAAFTAEEWQALIATKSNWNISLV
jgi:hypothetical protein